MTLERGAWRACLASITDAIGHRGSSKFLANQAETIRQRGVITLRGEEFESRFQTGKNAGMRLLSAFVTLVLIS
jgi:hypothetical protein